MATQDVKTGKKRLIVNAFVEMCKVNPCVIAFRVHLLILSYRQWPSVAWTVAASR